MKRIATWLLVVAAATTTACSAPNSHPETESAAVLATTPATERVTTAPAQPLTAPPAERPAEVPMPDVTCLILQDAQDRIQTAGAFFSRSEDATGAGRMQVLDRNWVVVSQSPTPGAPIGEGDAVLSVVKLGEPGDCS